jgi:hypothetical protein
MWREIFSQVLLPILEDNKIQIDVATKRQNPDLAKSQVHIKIVEDLLASINGFFRDKGDQLPSNLIVAYSDILALYAANGVNNQSLAIVTMT